MYFRVRQTNAWISKEGDVISLISYNTLICEVHKDSRTVLLSPHARYSRTTIRHLSEFLREFGISYYAAKAVLIEPCNKPVSTESGFTIYVSDEPRFRFRATSKY